MTADPEAQQNRSTPPSPPNDTNEKNVDEYPEGGRGWLVVLGGWCVSFSTFGYANTFGVYQDYYEINQLSNKTSSDVSWIGSLQLFFLFALGLMVGRLFDAGYLSTLTIVGGLLLSFSIMMVSLSTEYYQFILAQGVLQGISFGLLFIPSVSAVSHWFKRRRATSIGVLSTGSSIGGIVLPILLNKTINNPSIGFAWGVRATGFLIFGLMVIASLTLRTRLPPRKNGLLLDFTVFKEIPYLLFCIGAFFVMWGLYLPYFYTPAYIKHSGMSEDLSFYSISILNAASVFGRLMTNFAADYVGATTILTPCVFISSLLVFGWIGATNVGGMITFLILYGFSSGAYVSAIPACFASLTPTVDKIGVYIGMGFLVISVAALTGTPLMGAIVKHQGGEYWGAAVCAGLFIFVGGIVMTVGRQLQVKVKGSQKV